MVRDANEEIDQCLNDLLDATNLTDWECEFVDCMDKQRRRDEPFSEIQKNKILEIYDQRQL